MRPTEPPRSHPCGSGSCGVSRLGSLGSRADRNTRPERGRPAWWRSSTSGCVSQPVGCRHGARGSTRHAAYPTRWPAWSRAPPGRRAPSPPPLQGRRAHTRSAARACDRCPHGRSSRPTALSGGMSPPARPMTSTPAIAAINRRATGASGGVPKLLARLNARDADVPGQIKRAYIASVRAGRVGTREDIARAVSFVAPRRPASSLAKVPSSTVVALSTTDDADIGRSQPTGSEARLPRRGGHKSDGKVRTCPDVWNVDCATLQRQRIRAGPTCAGGGPGNRSLR
jgi:hypothetical protein